MENEEQMGQTADGQAPEDAFVAGMEDKPLAPADGEEKPAADPGGEAVTAPEDTAQGAVTEEPSVQTPSPDPVYAADTPAARSQRLQGVDEFARTFPEVYRRAREDPGTIPDSVWQAVGQGMSLTAAYAQHAVGRMAEDSQTVRQNRKNAQRSTGSMRSAGSDVNARDAFLVGFDL